MKWRYFAALIAALWTSAAAAQPIAEAVGAGFEVDRYSVALSPKPAGKSVSGTERITVRSVRDRLRSIVFSPNALTIDHAAVAGRETSVASDATGIAIALPSPLRRGQTVTISLRYHGVPKRGVTATATSMYTSYFACDWMICLQDAPGDKAWFDLDLRVPSGMTSLAAGRMVGRTAASGGAVIHRWRSTRPYSAYLFGFAIGPFTRATERAAGAELTYYGEGARAAELKQLFAETPAMVAFLSGKRASRSRTAVTRSSWSPAARRRRRRLTR